MKSPNRLFKSLLLAGASLGLVATAQAEPLKIAYSDWPGWVAWEIGIQKGWFKDEGVDVEFSWYDYVSSMDAYVAGSVDAVCMTNGDALVTGATGKTSVAVVINDYSNGNDMIVGAPDVKNFKDLAGRKVGIETGFVCHLLLQKGMKDNGMDPQSVEIVNTPTDETPQVLKSGAVSAIGAWQPNSGQALKAVSGAKPLYTSADAPGIIYDGLFVSPESLEARGDDWAKVAKVWYRIVEFMKDEDNVDEALSVLSGRVNLKPEEYEPFLDGTYILSLEEAIERLEDKDGLGSVYGSTRFVDKFNVENGVYEDAQDVSKYIDPSITKALAAEMMKK